MKKSEIKKAAEEHALEVLGSKQFNNPELKSAKIGIMDDFKSGVDWILKQQKKQTEQNK